MGEYLKTNLGEHIKCERSVCFLCSSIFHSLFLSFHHSLTKITLIPKNPFSFFVFLFLVLSSYYKTPPSPHLILPFPFSLFFFLNLSSPIILLFLVETNKFVFGYEFLLVGLNLNHLILHFTESGFILWSFVFQNNPMAKTELGSVLNRICCSNHWSYGVFWSFDRRNSM